MNKITRNRVKCLVCGAILESKFTHDFQKCDCENQTFVDGGGDYSRYGGIDLEKVVFLQEDDDFEIIKVLSEDL